MLPENKSTALRRPESSVQTHSSSTYLPLWTGRASLPQPFGRIGDNNNIQHAPSVTGVDTHGTQPTASTNTHEKKKSVFCKKRRSNPAVGQQPLQVCILPSHKAQREATQNTRRANPTNAGKRGKKRKSRECNSRKKLFSKGRFDVTRPHQKLATSLDGSLSTLRQQVVYQPPGEHDGGFTQDDTRRDENHERKVSLTRSLLSHSLA